MNVSGRGELMITPIDDRLVRGVLELEPTAHGVRPHRFPTAARRRFEDSFLTMVEAQPTGARVVFRTRATVVALDALPTRVAFSNGLALPRGVFEMLVDGRPAGAASIPTGVMHRIDATSGAISKASAAESCSAPTATPTTPPGRHWPACGPNSRASWHSGRSRIRICTTSMERPCTARRITPRDPSPIGCIPMPPPISSSANASPMGSSRSRVPSPALEPGTSSRTTAAETEPDHAIHRPKRHPDARGSRCSSAGPRSDSASAVMLSGLASSPGAGRHRRTRRPDNLHLDCAWARSGTAWRSCAPTRRPVGFLTSSEPGADRGLAGRANHCRRREPRTRATRLPNPVAER